MDTPHPRAEDLVDDFDDELTAAERERVDQAWAQVAARRLADLRAGRTEGIPYEVGMAQVRARLRPSRG